MPDIARSVFAGVLSNLFDLFVCKHFCLSCALSGLDLLVSATLCYFGQSQHADLTWSKSLTLLCRYGQVPQGAFECFRLWHAQAWPCVRHLRTKKKASAKCRDILELEATSIWFQAANSVQLRDVGALWLMIRMGCNKIQSKVTKLVYIRRPFHLDELSRKSCEHLPPLCTSLLQFFDCLDLRFIDWVTQKEFLANSMTQYEPSYTY